MGRLRARETLIRGLRSTLREVTAAVGITTPVVPHQFRHYATSRTMLPRRTGSGFGPRQASFCSAGCSLSGGIVQDVLVKGF